MNVIQILDTAAGDLRYAIRSLRKSPAFACAAILTLALSIGGNTAMFTVIDNVLLKPLAYPDAEQLVRISGGATPSRFEEMKGNARSFSGIGAFSNQEDLTLTGGAEPEVLSAARVSANFLDILGVPPIMGRSFRPEEDTPGGTAVAMISAGLWHRRFAQDSMITGKLMALGAVPYTIVGVLPPHFEFPSPNIDVWLTRPSEWSLMPAKSRLMSPFLTIFGRMRTGVNLQQANAELTVIHHRYALAHPAMLDSKAKTSVEVTRMKDELVAQVRGMLWLLFGAVCFVVLIACANVANLLMTRASWRAREFAVRSALGATRGRLVRQLLAESVFLSIAGGLLGLLVAAWGVRAIPNFSAFNLPRVTEIHLDWTVLSFAAVLSIGTGLLFGLAPSLAASRADLVSALRARTASASQSLHLHILSWFSVRGLLVIIQVALSVILLIGTALLLESVVQLGRVDVGFDSTNLLTLRVSLPLLRYDTDQKRNAFFEELVRRVQRLPGVTNATHAMFLPMTGFVGSPVQDAGKPPLKLNERPIATILVVAPNFFRTFKVPLRRGRDFNQHDAEGAPRVAIIDESFARRFWPDYPSGGNPIGQRLLIGGVNAKPVEIIGVAANVHQNLDNSAWPESVYVSIAQNAQPSEILAVRSEGEPSRLVNVIRQQVVALDSNQPISAIRTMDDLVDEQIGQRRLTMALLGAFAAVALVLAVVGIYGVVAYSVAMRTHEIGVRLALGAQHGNVLRLVTLQGLSLALGGVVVGLAGAAALTRLLTHFLFHVDANNPATFAGIAVLFIVVTLGATYIPARRAAGIDPMAALQVE